MIEGSATPLSTDAGSDKLFSSWKFQIENINISDKQIFEFSQSLDSEISHELFLN